LCLGAFAAILSGLTGLGNIHGKRSTVHKFNGDSTDYSQVFFSVSSLGVWWTLEALPDDSFSAGLQELPGQQNITAFYGILLIITQGGHQNAFIR
jgi:hypothetical protein